jgi:hypothetical protein
METFEILTINRTSFIKILQDYFPEEDTDFLNDIFDEMFSETSKDSRSRSFTFLKILTLYRRRVLKHRNISIPKNSKTLVDGFIDEVDRFCETFELKRSEGYLTFIKIGVSLMGKYRIQSFPSKVEAIFEAYEDWKLIEDDPNPKITQAIIDRYKFLIVDKTGTLFEPTTLDKVNFVQAAKFCKESNVQPEVLVDATFDLLSWKKAIPSTGALVSQKVHNRIGDYVSKNEIFVSDNMMVLKLKSLKKMKDD